MIMELMYGINIETFIGKLFYILLIFIVFDVVTGLLRAMKDRKINSSINYDGLIQKCGELFGVVFLTFVDFYLSTDGLLTKTGVGLLIIYETISIVENFKEIGVNLNFIMKYFDEDKYKEKKEDHHD